VSRIKACLTQGFKLKEPQERGESRREEKGEQPPERGHHTLTHNSFEPKSSRVQNSKISLSQKKTLLFALHSKCVEEKYNRKNTIKAGKI